MKNKIILTSVVAIMATCPVWADYLASYIANGNTGADCQGGAIDGQEQGTIVYTADWDPYTATVVFDCGSVNAGANADSNLNGAAAAPLTLTSGMSPVPTLYPPVTTAGHHACDDEGKTFSGWSCDHDIETGDATPIVSGGTTYTYSSNVFSPAISSVLVGTNNSTYTCYAQWDVQQFTVTYQQDGSCSGSSYTTSAMNYGSSYTLETAGEGVLSGITKPTGKSFGTWSCVDGNNNTVTPVSGQITIPSSNVTCTISCTFNVLNLRWLDANGTTDLNTGANSLGNAAQCTYGTAADAEGSINPINNPTKPGYTFKGWTISHQ